jgi:serine/threonine protein kinase
MHDVAPDTHRQIQPSNSGTPAYMAPELMSAGPPSNDDDLHSKSDVWALGTTLWSMTELQEPFEDMSPSPSVFWVADFHRSHKRLPFGSDFPASIQECVVSCWNFDPKLRPNVADVAAALNAAVPESPRPPPSPNTPHGDGEHPLFGGSVSGSVETPELEDSVKSSAATGSGYKSLEVSFDNGTQHETDESRDLGGWGCL